MKNIPFTPQKYQEIKAKVEKLEQLLKEVMQRLITAREMGDLSENGAYKYAKFEIGNIKRQLRQNRYLLRNGYPVNNPSQSRGLVEFGRTVTLMKDGDKQKLLTFVMVSQHESDPAQNLISTTSPIGQALLNKQVGDVVQVTTPKGENQYQVMKVE